MVGQCGRTFPSLGSWAWKAGLVRRWSPCVSYAAVAAAAVLYGCAASGPTTVTVVAQAASRTITAHTAHVTVTLALDASDRQTGNGSVDFQAGSVSLSFGNERIIIIGDDTYSLQPGATKWTYSHINRGPLSALYTGGNPSTLLVLLGRLSTSVQTVGEETVDGARASHVHAEISTAAADVRGRRRSDQRPGSRGRNVPGGHLGRTPGGSCGWHGHHR